MRVRVVYELTSRCMRVLGWRQVQVRRRRAVDVCLQRWDFKFPASCWHIQAWGVQPLLPLAAGALQRPSANPTSLAPGICRGLHGRKLEAGFSGRQDLLLFGEEAEKAGADKLGERDMWIGLDTSGATSGEAAAAAAGGGKGPAQA